MGVQIRVLQKGKITIPAEIRERLGIKEGDVLTLLVSGGKVILLPPRTVLNPTKLLDGLVEGVSLEGSIEEELKRASAARIKKKSSRSKH
ncbi:AbrB/MazE/SpoVT family DNA-binding domain-containing protein [Candidatus Bathyarchaeota archaeon]|nr:MAG: AbrB/MazE/SpoVT family DNA-binding domain-containing protein [Candidatus Bathyarchaeota archaeon]